MLRGVKLDGLLLEEISRNTTRRNGDFSYISGTKEMILGGRESTYEKTSHGKNNWKGGTWQRASVERID